MSNLNTASSSCHTDELHYMNSDGFFKLSHNHSTGSIPVISDLVKKVSNDYNSSSSNRSGFVGDQNESSMLKTKVEKKIRKPKIAFRTRSQVDVLDDGYRWRKYGQKAVKNEQFPRSYYKCTRQGCKVKKQVQRQSEDESIVITTYEDVHSHPIQKPSENFEQILSQMQYFPPFPL